MAFARKFRRRNKAPLGPVGVPTSDHIMLRAAKQFLDGETNIFESADDYVLVVVDLRDTLGALWASIELGLFDGVGGDDDRAREIIRDFVGEVVNYGGAPNPCPFVVFWSPRTAGLLDWLRGEGFGVPADWYPAIETAPQAGNVWTILKRNGAGVMMSVDYSGIEALGLVAVGTGSQADRTARTGKRAEGPSDEARKDRVHMFEYNREIAENAANAAVANGTAPENVVVYVIDTLDPLGRQIANAMDEKAGHEFSVLKAKMPSGHYPTLTAYLPRETARKALAQTHPQIAKTLESPPQAGCFWAVCIGSGGASLVQHGFRAGSTGVA